MTAPSQNIPALSVAARRHLLLSDPYLARGCTPGSSGIYANQEWAWSQHRDSAAPWLGDGFPISNVRTPPTGARPSTTTQPTSPSAPARRGGYYVPSHIRSTRRPLAIFVSSPATLSTWVVAQAPSRPAPIGELKSTPPLGEISAKSTLPHCRLDVAVPRAT